jgi:hypothetical protein
MPRHIVATSSALESMTRISMRHDRASSPRCAPFSGVRAFHFKSSLRRVDSSPPEATVVESSPLEDQIHTLSVKIKQLKREYEQYFLGSRPREPVQLKGEVQKLTAQLTSQPIQNTALRFKFSSLCSRYQAMRRQWDETMRKIEAGTYERHRFKADLHARQRQSAPANPTPSSGGPPDPDLFSSYRAQLRQKFGADANFQFRVAVEDGQVRLKAKRVG